MISLNSTQLQGTKTGGSTQAKIQADATGKTKTEALLQVKSNESSEKQASFQAKKQGGVLAKLLHLSKKKK